MLPWNLVIAKSSRIVAIWLGLTSGACHIRLSQSSMFKCNSGLSPQGPHQSIEKDAVSRLWYTKMWRCQLTKLVKSLHGCNRRLSTNPASTRGLGIQGGLPPLAHCLLASSNKKRKKKKKRGQNVHKCLWSWHGHLLQWLSHAHAEKERKIMYATKSNKGIFKINSHHHLGPVPITIMITGKILDHWEILLSK